MPPKRKTTRSATQSTLAFHGSANKVTKSGAKTARAKNIVDEPTAKPSKPEKVKLEVTEETEPTDGDSSLVPEPEKSVAVPPAPSTPEEDAARKITDKQIKAYWKKKEDQRNAPRVHQEKLSLHEKILIEFDMSGHYGPSVGISRMKRWKRAHKLRLEPPIEVLAVLLKEQEGSGDKHQRSRVDEILNSNERGFEA